MNEIGKKCYIIDKESIYYGEWGIVKHFDDEYYHVAIADGKNLVIFKRNEIRIPHKERTNQHGKENI